MRTSPKILSGSNRLGPSANCRSRARCKLCLWAHSGTFFFGRCDSYSSSESDSSLSSSRSDMSYVCMGDNGFSSTFGLDTAAGFFAGDVFAGSRMLLSAFFDFNCDGGTDVECWNLDMEEVLLLADDTAGIGSGFATDDNAVAAEVAADFSAMATFSFILARRMLLLVDLTLFGLEAEEWAAIFFRVDDAVAYLGWAELVVFVALFKP